MPTSPAVLSDYPSDTTIEGCCNQLQPRSENPLDTTEIYAWPISLQDILARSPNNYASDVSARLVYAITFDVDGLDSHDFNTELLLSACKTKGIGKAGHVSTGPVASVDFNTPNVASYSGTQAQLLLLSVNGSAIVSKLAINFRYQDVMPENLKRARSLWGPPSNPHD